MKSTYFFLLKTKNKKNSRKIFWESYQLMDIAFWNKDCFLRYQKFPNVSGYILCIYPIHHYKVMKITYFECPGSDGSGPKAWNWATKSRTLPLSWVWVPATTVSLFKSPSFNFFQNGLPFKNFLEQFAFLKKKIFFWSSSRSTTHYLKTYDFSGWLSIRNEKA